MLRALNLLQSSAVCSDIRELRRMIISTIFRSTGRYDSINALFDYNVVSPESDGSFRPDDKLLRKEAVSMLNAALGIEPDKAEIDKYVSWNGQPFSDVSESSPYYYAVLSAALGK